MKAGTSKTTNTKSSCNACRLISCKTRLHGALPVLAQNVGVANFPESRTKLESTLQLTSIWPASLDVGTLAFIAQLSNGSEVVYLDASHLFDDLGQQGIRIVSKSIHWFTKHAALTLPC